MEDSRKHSGKKSLVPGEVGLEKAGAGQGPHPLSSCSVHRGSEQQSGVGEGTHRQVMMERHKRKARHWKSRLRGLRGPEGSGASACLRPLFLELLLTC